MSLAPAMTERAPADPGAAARRDAAPLLLGALLAAILAGRGETLALSVLAAAAGVTRAGAGLPGAAWFRTLLGSTAFAVGVNLYLVPGRALPLPEVLGTPATAEGLAQGAGFATRLIVAALALHGLRAAWPGERAADELADRARPLERAGVPVRRLRAMLGLAIRFVPLLRDETVRIAAIQELRAGGPPRGLAGRLERLRAVAVPALTASLERAGQVALALEARHYRLREPGRLPRAGAAWRLAGWAVAALGVLWR